jgi:hypothetical protein
MRASPQVDGVHSICVGIHLDFMAHAGVSSDNDKAAAGINAIQVHVVGFCPLDRCLIMPLKLGHMFVLG